MWALSLLGKQVMIWRILGGCLSGFWIFLIAFNFIEWNHRVIQTALSRLQLRKALGVYRNAN